MVFGEKVKHSFGHDFWLFGKQSVACILNFIMEVFPEFSVDALPTESRAFTFGAGRREFT